MHIDDVPDPFEHHALAAYLPAGALEAGHRELLA
jgi:hypothetical protein